MIDIDKTTLKEIMNILRRNLDDNVSVYAFGSRVKNTARQYSDLDLLLKSEQDIPQKIIFTLKEEFEESDIPFRVDISDWHRLSETFKPFIDKEKVQINF